MAKGGNATSARAILSARPLGDERLTVTKAVWVFTGDLHAVAITLTVTRGQAHPLYELESCSNDFIELRREPTPSLEVHVGKNFDTELFCEPSLAIVDKS